MCSIAKHIRQAYPGERILVFSKFLKFHDLVDKVFSSSACEKQCSLYRFDGTVPDAVRTTRIRDFTVCKGTAVMLITAGSGGAGLKLTAASHVILCEPWWRDSDEQQAIGRAYRLGQKLPVHRNPSPTNTPLFRPPHVVSVSPVLSFLASDTIL
jgi:SNF2 family DNA or RNA helicase